MTHSSPGGGISATGNIIFFSFGCYIICEFATARSDRRTRPDKAREIPVFKLLSVLIIT